MTLIFFILSCVASMIAFVAGRKLSYLVAYAYSLALGAFTFYEAQHMGVTEARYFGVDSLGLLFLVILSVLGLLGVFHYQVYAERRNDEDHFVKQHNALFILFLAALVGVNISNHFGLLWAFLEATTLTGAALIYHDRNKLAMEAVWKYVFVASVSVAMAFTGILFLSIGATEADSVDFSFQGIALLAPAMNPVWLKACFLFVLIGFSVKMGLVPMFNVDIDAKDVSPSPVGAMFSSVLLNAGFVAIFRFYSAFAGSEIHSWMQHLLIITGVLSILFSASYLYKVKNFKRIFAYSCMEHAGLVILALAMGKPGYFAAILHLVFHSLVKSSLFFQIGTAQRVLGSKMDGEAGGYLYKNPAGGIVLLLGLFSVVALPPSGMFISELLILQSFYANQHFLLIVVVVLLLTSIMFTISRSTLRLLFISPENEQNVNKKEVFAWESLSRFALIGFTVYAAIIQPDFLVDTINNAIALLP